MSIQPVHEAREDLRVENVEIVGLGLAFDEIAIEGSIEELRVFAG